MLFFISLKILSFFGRSRFCMPCGESRVSADLAKIISSCIRSVNENRSTKRDRNRLAFEPLWHKSCRFCKKQQEKVFDFFCTADYSLEFSSGNSNFDLSVGCGGCVPSASRFLERKLAKSFN